MWITYQVNFVFNIFYDIGMVLFKELNNQLFKFTYRDNIILIRLHKVMKTFINTKKQSYFFHK